MKNISLQAQIVQMKAKSRKAFEEFRALEKQSEPTLIHFNGSCCETPSLHVRDVIPRSMEFWKFGICSIRSIRGRVTQTHQQSTADLCSLSPDCAQSASVEPARTLHYDLGLRMLRMVRMSCSFKILQNWPT